MSEQTYKCSGCGGTMEFDAASQALKCPNCGTVIPIINDQSKVVEHTLNRASMNKIRVTEKTSHTMECKSCGAKVEVEATCTATECPYCGSTYVLADKQEDVVIPAGIYQVYNKETSRYLRGPQRADGSYEWNAYVDYWMPFNGAIGMHDAYWQAGRFGGTYYMTGGSRGCINMPADKAEELYGWIAVGTPVITYYSQEMQFID